MLVDARQVDQDVETDVCVVGGGPAGITLAKEWSGSGFRVCLLESGGAEPDAATSLLAGESVGYPYPLLHSARLRGFGGTSWSWTRRDRAGRSPIMGEGAWDEVPLHVGWRARPLESVDFEARPGLPDTGWPLTLADLEPYYERAHRLCGLGRYSYEVKDWEDGEARRLPLDPDQAYTAIFHLGTTGFYNYYRDIVQAPNVTLFLHAHATELVSDEHPEQVRAVKVASHHGRRFEVRARFFVLAAGGLENARLLLLSRGAQSNGLGNAHDNVGRYFMERLSARAGWLKPASAGVVERARLCDVRRVGDAKVVGTLSLTPEALKREQLVNATFMLLPRSRPFMSEATRSLATLREAPRRRPRPERLGGHVRNVVVNTGQLAAAAYRKVRPDARDDALLVRVQAEQLPRRDSRVTLADARDPLGLRRLRLDWRVSDSDRQSIRRAQDMLDDQLRRAGIGAMERKFGDEDPPALIEGNYHHMGTTRMHTDPKKGVVTSDGRVHSTHNLYIAGSSVFPTAGYANPTLTLVALTVRLADHLKGVLDRRG